jgi:hypothetical protein
MLQDKVNEVPSSARVSGANGPVPIALGDSTLGLTTAFVLSPEQIAWSVKRKQGLGPIRLREMIARQNGCCALSGARLIFDKRQGTPSVGISCHPLYAAIDHVAPQNSAAGFQLVSYDLNDLKGHLPVGLFRALARSAEWIALMKAWRELAERNPNDISGFKALIWTLEAIHPAGEQSPGERERSG